MKKENIIKKNLEFQKIIGSKKQLINKFLIFYYVEFDGFEVGISIPRKFANAVKRNLIKRQIKWIIKSFVDYKKIKNKIVLIVRKDFIDLSIEEKKEEIIKMFNKFNSRQ